MSWIELHTQVYANKKVVRAAEKLTAADVDKLVGHLGRLWTWAIDHAEDGDLSHLPPDAIARAANWRGRSRRFIQVLSEVGLIDPQNRLANWSEYAGKLVERRKKDRERKKAEREGKRGVPEGNSGTSAGHPQDEYQPSAGSPSGTRPDQTVPKKDDDGGASHRDAGDIDGALVVLRGASWYPFNEAKDRAVIEERAHEINVVHEVRAWCKRANGQRPRLPRRALRGWLGKAREVSEEVAAADEAVAVDAQRSPRSAEEIIRAKGLPPEEEARLLASFGDSPA